MIAEMDENLADAVKAREGTELERVAIGYFADRDPEIDWDDLTAFQKFTWLAYAERRLSRDG